ITFDPDAGPLLSDGMSLDGNPAVDDRWPEYTLDYVDDTGQAKQLTLPLTTADWAATEGRFRKHFTPADPSTWNEDMVPFHEFLDLSPEDREGKTPFIHTIDRDKHLARLSVSLEIVRLAEERQQFWAQLKEIAGVAPSDALRDRLLGEVEAAYERKLATMKAEYEAKLAALPHEIARRMAGALLGKQNGHAATPSHPERSEGSPVVARVAATATPTQDPSAASLPRDDTRAPATPTASSAPSAVNAAPAAVATAEDDALAIDPYIDSPRCTSCNECINLNGKLFAYNGAKQATVANPDAGTFAQLVTAAERCPVSIIHPGTPRNPKEKDLPKWLKRAEPFS
ncbi:MAG TPA: ferredoxin, partial [Gemmatimonadaceae bacterium]|nr:ferredoxin [Gemmatimonadaceae bacterium]